MHPYKFVGFIWLLVTVLLASYETYAIATNQPTLSQWVWNAENLHTWLRWVIGIGFAVLIWHFSFHK